MRNPHFTIDRQERLNTKNKALSLPINICAALLFVAVLSSQIGCSDHETLSKAQAETLLSEARTFEEQHEMRDAYYKYKRVEGAYEVNDTIRTAAWDGAQRLRTLLKDSLSNIERELNRYRQKNGRYPDSLSDIENNLPLQTRALLDQIGYKKISDSEMSLHDGVNQ